METLRFDCSEESERLKALGFFKKFVIPLLPKYFLDVLEKREEENTWHEKSICWDFFQLMANHPEGLDNPYKQEGVMACCIPAPRGFWDAWIAIYCLENPKVFKNISVCARLLLQYIQDVKIDPASYINLESFHIDYLLKLARGEGTNFFFSDPMELVFLLKSYPMIEAGSAGHDWSEWMKKPEAIEQLDKLRTQTYEDVRKEFFSNKE